MPDCLLLTIRDTRPLVSAVFGEHLDFCHLSLLRKIAGVSCLVFVRPLVG